MSVYVDAIRAKYGRMVMCHMVADTVDELHAMADKIGLARRWFQNVGMPHYDICLSKKAVAIRHGALPIDRKKLVELIREWRKSRRKEGGK